jgi:hypothetical protein
MMLKIKILGLRACSLVNRYQSFGATFVAETPAVSIFIVMYFCMKDYVTIFFKEKIWI